MINAKSLYDGSAVYSIYFINNESMKYYGSSINLKKRIQQHVSCLKSNRHRNSNLQKEFNKGVIKENFIDVTKRTLQQNFVVFNRIRQDEIEAGKGVNIAVNSGIKNVLNKIFNKSTDLDLVGEIVGGLRTGDDDKFLKIHSEGADARLLLLSSPLRFQPSEDGPDPGHQLPDAERFGDVIIRA